MAWWTLALLGPAASASANSPEVTDASTAAVLQTKGVVLVDAYWSRVWKCGRFENAQLRSLRFERSPLALEAPPDEAAWTLENPSRLAPPRGFVSYAFLAEPGEYQLTSFEVSAARSITDVGAAKATRNELVADGRSKGGSFTVAAGEVVYIGNFAIDCVQDPIPWRYYTATKDFPEHEAQFKAKYPALAAARFTYRLFDTSTLGQRVESR